MKLAHYENWNMKLANYANCIKQHAMPKQIFAPQIDKCRKTFMERNQLNVQTVTDSIPCQSTLLYHKLATVQVQN